MEIRWSSRQCQRLYASIIRAEERLSLLPFLFSLIFRNTDSDKLEAFQKELTCSICMNSFLDPVTIDCGHSFCHPCLSLCWQKARFQGAALGEVPYQRHQISKPTLTSRGGIPLPDRPELTMTTSLKSRLN